MQHLGEKFNSPVVEADRLNDQGAFGFDELVVIAGGVS